MKKILIVLICLGLVVCGTAYSQKTLQLIELIIPSSIEFKIVEKETAEHFDEVTFNEETLYLHKESVLTQADIETMSIRKEEGIDKYSELLKSLTPSNVSTEPITTLLIKFKKDSWNKLEEVTTKYKKYRIAMIINGKVFMAPVIQESLKQGDLAMTGGKNIEEVLDVLKEQ